MRARMLLAVALGSVLGLGGVALPAAAAPSAIEFSRDGASWSGALAGSIFGDYRLVPSDAVTREVYIRNNAAAAGYLRITLRDVTTDNLDFAGALSVRADLVGWPGETVPVSSARPCARLSEGPVLPSGGVARVELSALLGALDGQRGQGGSAAFQIVVSLSGQPQGLGATGCPTTGASVAGYAPTVLSARPFRGGGAVYTSTASGWTTSTWVPGTSTDPTTTTPGTTLPTTHSLRVAANTDRFYQEYDAALWLLAALLGAAAAWIVLRRRPRAVPDHGPDQNGALR